MPIIIMVIHKVSLQRQTTFKNKTKQKNHNHISYLWESKPKIKAGENQKADNIHQKN